MLDLKQKAETAACICFYVLEAVGDCLLVTDSGGRKRYLIGYLDNGTVFWTRTTKEFEQNEIHARCSVTKIS